jgi:hypothetical protein
VKLDAQGIRIMATMWGLRNQLFQGKRERAARWFALADKYREVNP